MENDNALMSVLIYLGAAVIAVPIFRKLGLGAILGFLAAGIAIGPHVLGLVHDPDNTLHYAEIGVIFLLFIIGLELDPEKLWGMRRHILFLGSGQLFISALVIFVLCFAGLAMGWSLALVIGLALALSSTAMAIQLMAEYRILGTAPGRKGFAILLFQDLAVIPIMLLVEALGGNQAEGRPGWWLGALVVVLVILAGRYILNPFLVVVARYGSHEVMTAAALLIVLGTAVLMESAGLSMGMGAFVAGLMLANSTFRHQLEADIEPFKGLLLGLFFIAIGMTLDLQIFMQSPLMLILFAFGLIAIKASIISVLVRLAGSCWKDGLLLGLTLSQGGEFAFVVVTQATTLNIVDGALGDKISLIVGLSMAFTSPLVMLLRVFYGSKKNAPVEYDQPDENETPEAIIAGFGRFGQITGRMLTANNIHYTAVDKNADHIEFVKRLGNRVFFADANRLDLLESIGIGQAKLLLVAVDDPDESVQIVEKVRPRYKELKIIARARDRINARQLFAAGADVVHRETFSSALDAATEVLNVLGYSDGQALEKAGIFRRFDQKNLEKSLEYSDDQDKLLEMAKQGRKELEQLFNQDKAI